MGGALIVPILCCFWAGFLFVLIGSILLSKGARTRGVLALVLSV
jgi:hypothetical protein